MNYCTPPMDMTIWQQVLHMTFDIISTDWSQLSLSVHYFYSFKTPHSSDNLRCVLFFLGLPVTHITYHVMNDIWVVRIRLTIPVVVHQMWPVSPTPLPVISRQCPPLSCNLQADVHIYFPSPPFLQVLSHWVHMAAPGMELATFTCHNLKVDFLTNSRCFCCYRGSFRYYSMNGGYLSCFNSVTAYL